MRSWILWIAVVALALGLMGGQQAEEAQTQAEETMVEAETVVEDVMEEVPIMDPVCGMEVTAESEFTAEYEGVTFYFCSEGCRDKFIEEPGKFLEAAGEEVMGT